MYGRLLLSANLFVGFTVEISEKHAEPLLSSDFLRECTEMFSIPSRALGVHARTFLAKNLNIVDPLKESNNLGRSVSKGNRFFSYLI